MSVPNRVAFQIGSVSVYWYGILIALALLLGTMLGTVREKQFSLKKDTSLNFVLLAVPLSVVCARLYYVVFSLSAYRSNLLEILNLREGGLAIYGGVIGGFLAAWIYARRSRVPLGSLCDLCAPCLALGQAIGRWGNFFNQEAYGLATSSPSLRFFPLSVYISALDEWHLATFFYESAWCLLITVSLLLLERKRAFSRQGDEFCWYAVLYALERAVVEGLRTDSLMLGSIRISQLLAWTCVLAAGICFGIRARRAAFLPKALLALAWAGGLAAILLHDLALLLPLSIACCVLLILLYRANAFKPAL